MFKKMVLIDKTGIDEFVLPELELLSEEVIVYPDMPASEEEILARAKGADALLVSWNTKISAKVIKAVPTLKYIGMCCSLYDEASANVDIQQARQQNIVVKGVRDYGDQGAVEFVFSELIRLFLGLGKKSFRPEPIELGGIKYGVIGMGTLGRQTADTAHFFHMDVSYYSRTIKNEVPYPYLPLEKLLTECDVVSLHLPRNNVVLDEKAFRQLGNGKVLINTGLGLPFEKEAFDRWMENPLNFAILDADSITPEFRTQYKDSENIVLNKRVSGFTRNARVRLAHKVVDNIRNYFAEC